MIFPLQSSYAIQEEYLLEIDTHSYNISYSLEGDLLAMAIDNELNSLLIGIENVSESIFEITLPDEMINAENHEFAVLVNGVEVLYWVWLNFSAVGPNWQPVLSRETVPAMASTTAAIRLIDPQD